MGGKSGAGMSMQNFMALINPLQAKVTAEAKRKEEEERALASR